MIIDLTPIRANTGPARLLDMVEGRSKQMFKTWLAERDDTWRNQVEVVAMDGFTGFKTATAEELPDATAVIDPFHVVRLAGDALDQCRRRVQQELHGHRGRATDPLYRARRTLHTGTELLTNRQKERLEALFDGDDHVAVEATWAVYQQMIGAYRETDPAPDALGWPSSSTPSAPESPPPSAKSSPWAGRRRSEPPTCSPTSTGPAVRLVDTPCFGASTVLLWRKRTWACPEPSCPVGVFTEQDSRVARPRAMLTSRACRWVVEQLRHEHASITRLARQPGTTWRTEWTSIAPILQGAADDEARFAGVTTLGVDEHL